MPDREAVEVFLQEASEHLQYLREYIGALQEIAPRREDLERLYISAHTLSGTSASYGFPRFSEISGKLAHVFQYAMNASLGEDLHGPLTEFLSDGISLLESDLLEISDTGKELVDDISDFKERYRFAFQVEPAPLNYPTPAERHAAIDPTPSIIDLCLESVDVLKKTLHKQWTDESETRTGIDSLLNKIAEVAPMEAEESAVPEPSVSSEAAVSGSSASDSNLVPRAG